MIFSTRWHVLPDYKPHSIFKNCELIKDDQMIIEQCRAVLGKIDSVPVLNIFRLDSPEQLIEIATILAKVDTTYDFTLDPDLLEDGFLQIEIQIFISEKLDKISDDIIKELVPYCIRSIDDIRYALREEKIKSGEDEIIYRAIGTMHLPKGEGRYGKRWASFLVNRFTFGDSESEETYLCLHGGSDYLNEDHVQKIAADLNKAEDRKISVLSYHHDVDIYDVAKILLMKDENLSTIWDQLKSIKDGKVSNI